MFRYAFILSLAASATQAWELNGFEHPESIVLDSAQNVLFVSNIGGNPTEADGNGFISRVAPDGTLIDLKWATGMNAPKGMALMGDRLIVSDLTQIHVVDATSGALLSSHEVAGAQFLNDVTATATRAWISDMFTGAIYEFDGTAITPFFHDATLPHPNGLWTDGTDLVVASWGSDMQADFSTKAPGDLLSITLADKTVSVIAPAMGNLDGITKSGDSWIVNDWISGEVFKVTGGTVETLLTAPASTADLTAGNGVLYLPHMFENRISTVALD
ncbi:hypothetical protein N6L24_07805 [Cognatishimia sp. SS12]|uniref:SMP-30/gluconolactonase/LRE family protein n=1 Tax=Cognatishimia sp. SS12 TaxID=2979465 RepID=UPI00232B6CFC|nr:hypothetical protein [Cognatishimia sp. SS12]MDC0738180.1 hypothetical protein [Cognatishimia sp. SS12]